jgi:hypothetical protein
VVSGRREYIRADAEVSTVLGMVSEWWMALGCIGLDDDGIYQSEMMAAISSVPDSIEGDS